MMTRREVEIFLVTAREMHPISSTGLIGNPQGVRVHGIITILIRLPFPHEDNEKMMRGKMRIGTRFVYVRKKQYFCQYN